MEDIIKDRYSLYNKDCLNVMKTIGDETIDLIITDPPYGVEFSHGFDDSKAHVADCIQAWLTEMYRVLKDGSHCYIFVPIKEIDLWVSSVKTVGFTFMNLLSTMAYTQNVYFKNNFSYNNQLIIYCAKGTAKQLNKVDFVKTSDSWFHDKRNHNPHEYTYQYPAFLQFFSNSKSTSRDNCASGRHPCSKNVSFEKFLIELSSQEGDVVLDPFAGGCSSGVAALETGRRFIGCETNATYFEYSCKRLVDCE